jgi:FkbM family methyltransferase
MPEFSSTLERLIPAEIKDDELYQAIQMLSREADLKTVLEIGSSSGSGSTEAFVTGLMDNPKTPDLYCMEVSQSRFEALQKRYENYPFVHCYHVSSVGLEQFPTEAEIQEFYQTQQTYLNLYPLEQVLDWWKADTEYLKTSGVETHGIRKIKTENNIDVFDLVLIDGSEFTGIAELEEVYGATLIILDDINTFKNYQNYTKLLTDSKYTLLQENKRLRNGYAIFGSVSYIKHRFDNEIKEQNLVKALVKPGMIAFDVGANLGDYSILLSQLVGESGKVYTFEPTSSIFEKLETRLNSQGLNNINVFQKAVFSEDKEIEFHEFPDDYSVWNSIGMPQMPNPENPQENIPIAKTEIVEGISLDSFCKTNHIERIDYLKIDVEGAESDVLLGTVSLLQQKKIRFLQFEISQKMLEGLNRKAKDTFKILIDHGYECHRIEADGRIGEKVIDSHSFYENYIAFPEMPVHFFTIVLNGEPFVRYHIEVLKQLPFKWHWHIIEGVADLKHDTSWSVKLGGKVTDEIHNQGLSKDGTSEYLDQLKAEYPENITLYRKPKGEFWDGKREMVNAPLANIQEECLLWQIDVDEIWTVDQICNARRLFVEQGEKTAAYYWCWYFVGEQLVISTRNCYTQNPQQDWLRTWRFKPGYVWAAHEPPILVEPLSDGEFKNIAALNPLTHDETEKEGLVFQHFAYVTPEQLRFKEQYYGYQNAVNQWRALQSASQFPVYLRDYFAWVGDETRVDRAESLGIVPLVQKDVTEENWKFLQPQFSEFSKPVEKRSPTIIIDGVFFQLYQTGIARVWRSLLAEWAKTDFANHVLLLDRSNTAQVPGIPSRIVPAYNYNNTEADKQMLQEVCDREGADLFISTYYTTPLSTPSVFMAYDMIPEVLGADLNQPMWREKHHAISHADAYISISESTARDLVKFFPEVTLDQVTVAHCGVSPTFTPATAAQISEFKYKYGITKPYFLLVGAGGNYKNAILFFRAFAELHSKQGFEIVCTGSGLTLGNEYRQYASGTVVHPLVLSDEELRVAYSGAVALVYPSVYEGFGMPVAEALACGCPVITCANASLPEVGGDAVIYVDSQDVEGLAEQLCEVQKPKVRRSLIAKGLEQVKQFSWQKMADTMSSALLRATLAHLNLREINLIVFPDWSQPEERIGLALQEVIKGLVSHGDRAKMTLLIDHTHIEAEDADLLLSSVAMNLLMEENLEVDEGPEIVLVGDLSEAQWSVLIPQLRGRIRLEDENQEAIALSPLETIPVIELGDLHVNKPTVD